MIRLPSPTQAYLKSFWTIGTAIFSVVVYFSTLSWAPSWTPLAVTSSLLILGYGLLEINLRIMWMAYKVWNILAERATSILQTIILCVCFFVILVLVGRFGSALKVKRDMPANSLWSPKGTIPIAVYESQSTFPTCSPAARSWELCYLTWSSKSRKYWTWFLLPFLYLLSILEPERNETAPQGIYTLY